MFYRGDAGKKPKKEPDYKVKDPAVIEINRELARLKDKCESEGLAPEEAMGRLIAHAAEKLGESPELVRTHRFSWISGQIELRLTPDKG